MREAERRPHEESGGRESGWAAELKATTVQRHNADNALFGVALERTPYGTRPTFTSRDDAVAAVEDASDDQDRAVIDQAIREVGRHLGVFSANDVRDLLPTVRPALIGARFLAAAKAGQASRIGWVISTDAGTHGRPIGQWRWLG